MNRILIDFETRSEVDLKKAGAFAYARHPSTEILCMAYKVKGEKTKLIPREYFKSLSAGPTLVDGPGIRLVAHSVQFEYAIYNSILAKSRVWPALYSPKHWDCTQARAAMCGLPQSLENAGHALNISRRKSISGRAVMHKLCKPTGYDKNGKAIFNNDPKLFEELYAYCIQDVEAEDELDDVLPQIPDCERPIFELDLIMNARGIKLDVNAARCAKNIAAKLTKDLNLELYKLTGGKVDKASRIAEMKRYLDSKGLSVKSLDKEALANLLSSPNISPHIKEVLNIRRQVGKSSTAKYEEMLNVADPVDGRLRGLLQYHGAATGRWAGRKVQPQNFPKGIGFKADVVAEHLTEDEDLFKFYYGDKSMDALSAALRGVLIASDGCELLVADYSAIEARVLAWLAGEETILSKYRLGMNMYVAMAKAIYGREINKEKDPFEYAVGKAVVLGAGYQMWVDRFVDTCRANNIDISPELAERALRAYREECKNIVKFWYDTERAAVNAVSNPGSIHKVGKVLWTMSKDRRFLGCKLPSGRWLRYYRPSVRCVTDKWGREKPSLFYWTTDDRKGDNFYLAEFQTYGGALVENITQATARDIMANGMLNVEKAGMRMLLTVHDECIAEAEEGRFKVEDLVREMCATPPWAAGCPIAAEGWKGKRYKKK